MSPKKSKTEIAYEFIVAQGGALVSEIASHAQIAPKNVMNALHQHLAAGHLERQLVPRSGGGRSLVRLVAVGKKAAAVRSAGAQSKAKAKEPAKAKARKKAAQVAAPAVPEKAVVPPARPTAFRPLRATTLGRPVIPVRAGGSLISTHNDATQVGLDSAMRQPRPPVGKNTGSEPSVVLPPLLSAEGLAVAPEAPDRPVPAPVVPVRDVIRIQQPDLSVSIDLDGALIISNHENLIELDASQTRRLGEFLHDVQPVWEGGL